MACRPLEYDSLKIVLEHMEANLRFRLFKRIPSIRNVERIVPLNIDRLRFDSNNVVVNDNIYQLGIYKGYPSSEVVPDNVQRRNKSGGLLYDIDHLGFRDFSTREILTPGDINIQRPEVLETFEAYRMREAGLKQNVATYIEMEEKRIEARRAAALASPNERQRNPIRIEITFNIYQEGLEPYYHLRDGTAPKYERQIQLTIKSESTKSTIGIERVKYNKQLYEAQKYLSNILFEGRKANIRVKELIIPYTSFLIIRFPVGLKLKIRGLKVADVHFLGNEELMSLIDSSSYPLQQFRINDPAGELNIPIIKTAQKLVLGGIGRPVALLRAIRNLSHKNVILFQYSFTAEEHFLVVMNWLESNREVGTDYVFTKVPDEVADGFLKIVAERIDGAVTGERSVTIPMNNSVQLKISCAPYNRPAHCSVKMETVQVVNGS